MALIQNVGASKRCDICVVWLTCLYQVSLMIFILDAAIGAAVFLPYLLGKSLALNLVRSTIRLHLTAAQYLDYR